MRKVSVIIPIYNVEEYLRKCLDSVCNQTYSNLEIICVNDCSSDNSNKILDDYIKNDSRIKILSQEKNCGLSAARNVGLDVATGEYVYFLDSDDWIDSNYIEKMLEVALKTNSEIVLNTNIIAEYATISEPFPWPTYSVQLPQGEFLDNVTAVNNTQCMVWAHLYKKDFLNNYDLRFPKDLIHEDVYFQYVSKIYINKLFAFYGPSYHYLQRTNSIMGLKKNTIENLIKIYRLSYEFYKKNDLLKKYNNVQIFKMTDFCNINTESDFQLLKEYFEYILNDFMENPHASSEMDKFIFTTILNAENYNQYQKKLIKNNWFLTYIIRKHHQKSKKQKISIIIPVYNVDKYLRRCLDSVCHQTYSNLEIICVDDCSTDNSLAILNEYADKDERIRIMQRHENGGQAAARQTGIDVATGEYIGFVDSDDWVDADFYEKMLKVALQDKTDIVINSSILVHEGEKVYPQSFQGHNMLERKVYDNPAQLVEKFFCVVWNKLFRMDFLRQQKYTLPKANAHEDVFFHYITFAIAKNVSFFDGPNYHYLHREHSLAQVKHDWGIAHIKVYSYIYDFYKEHGLLDKKIKLYATMPQFNITDDETFNVYKSYFAKVAGYINQNSEIFNEADKFIANAVVNCPDYATYKATYPANLMISFLRRKNE